MVTRVPSSEVRPTTAIDVVGPPDINLEQVSKLLETVGGSAGCRACGLLGIDLRLIGPDPAALKQLGIGQLPGVQSAVVSQRQSHFDERQGDRRRARRDRGNGASYEGGDPTLLGRLAGVVDYLEVTPDSIARGERDSASIDPQVLGHLRDVAAGGVGIVAHGVGLSIGSASGWNNHYLALVDELSAALPLRWHAKGYERWAPGLGGPPGASWQRATGRIFSRCARRSSPVETMVSMIVPSTTTETTASSAWSARVSLSSWRCLVIEPIMDFPLYRKSVGSRWSGALIVG